MSKWIVTVLEGNFTTDTNTYYCDEEPVWVSEKVEGVEAPLITLAFTPKNGVINRVGKLNHVPRERVVAVTKDFNLPD